MWNLDEKFRDVKTRELNWHWRGCRISEADLRGGVKVIMEFPDPEGVLEAAVDDFKEFCKRGNIKVLKRDGYPIICRLGGTSEPESYRLSVETECCTLEAGDSEGIRRGLYYLMSEMMLCEGPFLKLGEVGRRPAIRRRLAHEYPIDIFEDELGSRSEAIVDSFLSMLARDGFNGLLLTVDLKKLAAKFKVYTGKLTAYVEQCRRYGIDVYLFCTEPISFDRNCPVFEALPELKREKCYDDPVVRERLAALMERVFGTVTNLRGVIFRSLKDGYKAALCAKDGSDSWKNASATLKLVDEAVKRANPRGEVIFWPYEEVFWRGLENQLKGAAQLPRGIAQMRNLEGFGSKQQMGEKRVVADNWLSLIGPSVYFKASVKRCKKAGDAVFAMLPIGSSLEIPTVRSMPVPSNYYRKFRAMRSLGIDGIVQGWETGLFPSEMTHAAGLLAFDPFPATEDIFLNKIARMYWDERFAGEIVTAWKHFSQAFNHFPLCHEFRESGPLQDSVIWHLNLLPAGDDDFAVRIDSCMADCEFDLVSTSRLMTKLTRRWAMGVRIMQRLSRHFRQSLERMREIAQIEAIGVLFEAGNGIFKFHELRNQILQGEGPERLLKLKNLRKMVRDQIEYSRRMIMLIEKDPMIGFHFGEGVYRFNAAMLEERITALRLMLQKEFPVVEKRLKAGLPALEDD